MTKPSLQNQEDEQTTKPSHSPVTGKSKHKAQSNTLPVSKSKSKSNAEIFHVFFSSLSIFLMPYRPNLAYLERTKKNPRKETRRDKA